VGLVVENLQELKMSQIEKYFMEKNRLETLIDGIFAIVMTLLVMNVVVPHRDVVLESSSFIEMLQTRMHDIANYALSFSLLAILWIQHHKQAHFIKKTNLVHIWINIASMFFVALIPFSTSLVVEFPEQDISEIIFGSNIFVVGFLLMINWLYATGRKRLVDDKVSDSVIARGRNNCILLMIIALFSIFLSQIHPDISADIFWLIPVLLLSEQLFKKRKAKE
jgi:uncharacterized membrane protein